LVFPVTLHAEQDPRAENLFSALVAAGYTAADASGRTLKQPVVVDIEYLFAPQAFALDLGVMVLPYHLSVVAQLWLLGSD